MPIIKFILGRLLAIPITLLCVTAVLYAIVMLAPAEERAMLYWPPRSSPYLDPAIAQRKVEQIIDEQGLNDPYYQQYGRWAFNLLRGDWGWSPALNGPVLGALLARTGVTAELTLYSLLTLIPLGLFSGVVAGWRENQGFDRRFRLLAFIGNAVPPFILGLFLLSIFYVGLYWFPPGRTGITELSIRTVTTFRPYTGLLTVDGLLNGRWDVTVDAFRHLVLPVFTLSLTHWATLGRVTRAAVIDVKEQEYVGAARARGLRSRSLIWRHTFPNAILPGLTSSALTAASLVTGVFIVEVIFDLKGLSELIVSGMRATPDAPLAMGFAVYTVFLVLPIMFVLDILKAAADPRVREGMIEG